MHRRSLLEMFAGVAIAGLPSLQTPPRRIVIAGAGMLGANIAYQLARRGASVTVVERTAPGTGATAKSFAWINAKKRPHEYFDLSRLGLLAWRQLDREFEGRLPLVWGGSLEWRADAEAGAAFAETLKAFQSWGDEGLSADATRRPADCRLRAQSRKHLHHSDAQRRDARASHWPIRVSGNPGRRPRRCAGAVPGGALQLITTLASRCSAGRRPSPSS